MQRALWVEVESAARPLESPGALETLFKTARALKISDLYLQVYRSGRAWFRSVLADAEPFERAYTDSQVDVFQSAIQQAGHLGLRVHAWINVFNLGTKPSQKILAQFSSEALQVDSSGLCIDQYEKTRGIKPGHDNYKLDTPGIWLDPAAKEIKNYILNLVRELRSNYPEMHGLHLDFFRYPYLIPIQPASWVKSGFDFGYSPATLARFETETGHKNPLENEYIAIEWDSWRRAQISAYLKELREIIGAEKSLSVAAIPWSDRSYLNCFQNWQAWLVENLVDSLALMSYTADHRHFQQLLTQALAFRSLRSKLLAGIGTYKFSNANEIEKQIEIAKASKADGIILFSYGDIQARGIFSGSTPS